MKKTALFAATVLGVSALSASAFAQKEVLVPGSEAAKTAAETQSRDNVAAGTATSADAVVANPTQETLVPGNTQEIDDNESKERDAIAAGTAAETTTPTGDTMPAASVENNSTGSADDSGSVKTDSPIELQKATPATAK